MTLIVIARFFFVKIKITLVGSPKKRPAITKKNLAITKIFDFRAVFWHITWISTINFCSVVQSYLAIADYVAMGHRSRLSS